MLVAVTQHAAAASPRADAAEEARWAARAAAVTIARDDWGIPHIDGRTDADAVFGMIYAQAEDDFPRIERNYATALGRLAAADGQTALWSDLRARLYYPEHRLRALQAGAPPWLQALTVAWADALNFYLARHPQVRPRYIARFEPWMAFSFTEGSIGGDIEEIDQAGLRDFYGEPGDFKVALLPKAERQASNGVAIAPKLTASGHALLLINPHTTHYFRSEAKVRSGDGLNVYGASTWGQFFVYQGFNATAGWMHTSSTVDRVSRFAESVVRQRGQPSYRYGSALRPFTTRTVEVPVRRADGTVATRRFEALFTHRGPVVGKLPDRRWLSFAMMDKPVEALSQSLLRTKAGDYAAFRAVAGRFRANSSNDTVFADAKGTVALDLPEFVARRGAGAAGQPLDGTDPVADWAGEHPAAAIPSVVNPASGFVFNTNNGPWDAAGPGTLPRAAFAPEMDAEGENARGLHALALFPGGSWTAETLRQAAYSPDQPAFAVMVPALVRAWDAEPAGERKERLTAPIAELRRWDYRWGEASVAQTLAVLWGEEAVRQVTSPGATRPPGLAHDAVARLRQPLLLDLLEQAVAGLSRDFGTWRVPWGEVNRMQRSAAAGLADERPSIAVPYDDGQWGSLAVARARPDPTNKRRYVTYGNSFVAVAEFGPRVKAQAVMAGGQSGDPASPHWFDQAQLLADGKLRPVYFHDDELQGHVVRRYRPGE